MLASPLLPSPRFAEDSYRPAKDLEAFNKLLPPPIEFVEGSSSCLLAAAEGKYQPINEPKAAAGTDSREYKKAPSAAPAKAGKFSQDTHSLPKSLYAGPIDTHWPRFNTSVASGLQNTGNTCFLNSALQVLLHTTPLLHVLQKHGDKEPCRVPKGAYCAACAMRQVMYEVYNGGKSKVTAPYPIITKLHAIAKHMRRGRQEDSHEFLRYLVEALQKSALAGYPPKLDPKLAEKTWVHMIFGGLLRSRVKCLSCGHNSDTFDRMLDLSVDIAGVQSVRDALRKFVAVDHLRGADRYKCEKCKKAVNADKQFTVHEAPLVLTLHLKRFSPMGRKIAQPVKYDDHIKLGPYMSEGSFGPSYSLYGVISHAGGGPNSGHYYAHVKGPNGSWFEMNDDYVSPNSNPPTNMRNAYVLFYIRDKGQALEAAVNSSAPAGSPGFPVKTGLVANMKKRKTPASEDESERPSNAKLSKPFIGPRLPGVTLSTSAKSTPKIDPQAEALRKKIAAASSEVGKGLQELSQYTDDSDDDDDMGEKVPSKGKDVAPLASTSNTAQTPARSSSPVVSSPRTAPSSQAPTASGASSSANAIPPSSFYGTPVPKANDKKRKSPDGDEDASSMKEWVRKPLSPPPSKERRRSAANPYTRLKGSDNLNQRRDSMDSPGRSRSKPHKKRFLM